MNYSKKSAVKNLATLFFIFMKKTQHDADALCWVYVPTDFDTKRKALSRANAAEKGLK
ncbi:hypothetical protein OZY50_00500 [Ligilactobacillus murinus]|uniref:hypothetical protein n=1 Tax=Ligilactobacillus murinus TaxID=1622 RepID=UPI0022868A1F|nr:hypothetical protein [Ligilactobacillus murinus]MCZ0699580.1 hypothetical protein [Ligilactobacillus murinus]